MQKRLHAGSTRVRLHNGARDWIWSAVKNNAYEIIDCARRFVQEYQSHDKFVNVGRVDVVILQQAVAETLRRLCAVYSRVTRPPRAHIPTHN